MEIHKPVVINGTYVRNPEHICQFPNAIQRVWQSKDLNAWKLKDWDKFTCTCGKNYTYSGPSEKWVFKGYAR